MNDWLELSMPWWQFALRGLIAYVGLLILLRLAGRRAFGEMTPFDIVVLILVGGALRSAIVGKDESVLGPFIAIVAILAADRLLGVLTQRSRLVSRWVEGTPLPLVRAGRLLPNALRRASISDAAFERELRLREVRSVDDLDAAELESNGKISVFKKAG